MRCGSDVWEPKVVIFSDGNKLTAPEWVRERDATRQRGEEFASRGGQIQMISQIRECDFVLTRTDSGVGIEADALSRMLPKAHARELRNSAGLPVTRARKSSGSNGRLWVVPLPARLALKLSLLAVAHLGQGTLHGASGQLGATRRG
jgi:hypothetical protein